MHFSQPHSSEILDRKPCLLLITKLSMHTDSTRFSNPFTYSTFDLANTTLWQLFVPLPPLIDTNIHVTIPHVPVAHGLRLFDVHGTTPMGAHMHSSSPIPSSVYTCSDRSFLPNLFGMPTSMAAHNVRDCTLRRRIDKMDYVLGFLLLFCTYNTCWLFKV